ncbi:secreted RxLR effector protein 161-like [Phragmites australis]|uniref:secreted RxLR effector protein 161-like n=1 Tax=Phragmites australis TaxID=29695 RepID=UPI002D76DC60|nr:secreted RxLR effector protein 161-like [Phragmites australis]
MTSMFHMSDLGLLPYYLKIEEWLKLCNMSMAPLVDATHYRSIVGGLRYLVYTWLGITFVVGYASQYIEDSWEDHYMAVKHLLRYVAGTRGYGVIYKKEGGATLAQIGYNDSDMGGDLDDRKSTTDVFFLLGHSPISWQSKKQRVIALSTCEAKYIAATTAACQRVWLARLLQELTSKELQALTLMVDNKSVISLRLPRNCQN